jgi:hypothetical protein
MCLNEKLASFFDEDIFDLDENEVNVSLDKFDRQDVLQCLFSKLKSLAKIDYGDEWAWRLGRKFGDISLKYSADEQAYLWINISNDSEKQVLINFLSGYWDQAEADIYAILKLSNITSQAILNKEWSQKLILAAIDAVAIGYVNNKKLFENNVGDKTSIEDNLEVYREYLSNIQANSQSIQQLLNECLK